MAEKKPPPGDAAKKATPGRGRSGGNGYGKKKATGGDHGTNGTAQR